jgi:hypothetical protein
MSFTQASPNHCQRGGAKSIAVAAPPDKPLIRMRS